MRVRPGIDPDREALAHVRDRLVDEQRADREHGQAEHRVQMPAGGDVDHRQEDPEQEQRRAEVVHHGQHAERDRRHQRERAEMAGRGDVDPEHAPACVRQHLAVLAQVPGQRDDQQELHELARLHLHAADADPQAGAVHRRPGDHREQEQADGNGCERVLVRLQAAVVAQHEDQPEEADQARRRSRPTGRGRASAGAGRSRSARARRGAPRAGSSHGSAFGSPARTPTWATANRARKTPA